MANLAVPDSGYFEYCPLVLKRYLDTRVTPDIAVTTQIPNPRPPRLVVIRSSTAPGSVNLALSTRRNIILCWDRTEILAVRTAEKVRGYLVDASLVPGNGIRAVTVVGEPVYYPDPDDPSASPRAQLTVDILLRASFAP